MTPKRLKLAYLIAPIFPVLLSLLFFQNENSARYSLLILIFSIPVSYLSCLLFGLPLISFLKKFEKLTILNISISGAILGSIVFYLFGFVFSYFLGSTPSTILPSISELFFGAILGVSVAFPFGVIAGFPFIGNINN